MSVNIAALAVPSTTFSAAGSIPALLGKGSRRFPQGCALSLVAVNVSFHPQGPKRLAISSLLHIFGNPKL